jgi:hypothetical protein
MIYSTKRVLLFFGLIGLLSVDGNAQININSRQVTITDLFDPAYQNDNVFADNQDVEGSRFLYEEWKKADITTRGGTVFRNIDVKYDLYGGDIAFKNGDQEMILDRDQVKSVKFISSRKEFVNVASQGYLEKLGEGNNYILFKKTAVQIYEGAPATGYNYGSTKDRWEKSSIYLARNLENDNFIEVDMRKSSLIMAFDLDKKKVRDFLNNM